MKLINPLILFTLLFTIFSANAENRTTEVKGEATIIVDNKTYTFPLKKCYSGTNTEDGKTLEAFVIASLKTKETKASGIRFSAIGSKTEKTGFVLQVGGGISKGGKRYQGKMPYESFKDNKLIFEGNSNRLKKENKKLITESVSINIRVSCNES